MRCLAFAGVYTIETENGAIDSNAQQRRPAFFASAMMPNTDGDPVLPPARRHPTTADPF
ncbi:MAG: hypothetical protein RBJ76_04680 [Stenomitos frigidus ULC029]